MKARNTTPLDPMEQTQKKSQATPLSQENMEPVIQVHQAPLTRYAARMVNDPTAAQDVVQDTFIRLHRTPPEFEGPADIRLTRWLYRVTHNRAVDYIRSESRRKKLSSHEETTALLDKEATAGKRHLENRIALILEQLSILDERERQIVLLRFQEGRTYDDIAAIAETTPGNVGYLLHHAIRKISTRLQTLGLMD